MPDQLIINNLIDDLIEPYKEVYFGSIKFVQTSQQLISINPSINNNKVIHLAQPYGRYDIIYFRRNKAFYQRIFATLETDLNNPDSIQLIKGWIEKSYQAYKDHHGLHVL